MKKLERLDETTAPDGTVLTLYRHDRDYYIRAGRDVLMSTRRHQSEDELAALACAPLRRQPRARVLIGGLGLGFTLKAALATLDGDAEVVVVELVEAVIRWNRNPDYDLAAAALQDARVTLVHGDVGDTMAAGRGAFDAIIMDVDNGAEALTSAGNARLYRDRGVRTAAAALRPGGRLAYWLSDPDPSFEAALRRAGLSVEEHVVRAHPSTRTRHVIYLATAAPP
jgi:spermidine synthase